MDIFHELHEQGNTIVLITHDNDVAKQAQTDRPHPGRPAYGGERYDDAPKMALRSIGSNKMRAVLTMLGIIIGVMALVVLVSLVNGATSSVTDAVSSLGSDMLTVTISDDKGRPVDMETLSDWMDERAAIGLTRPGRSTARHGQIRLREPTA